MMLSLYGVGIGVGISAVSLYLANIGTSFAKSKPTLIDRGLGNSKLATFPYGGDQPFAMTLLPHCLAIGATSTAAAIALTTLSGPITSLQMAKGPVLVTLMWLWGYYNMISAQLKQKMGGGNEQAARVAERSLYNTLEQGVPFLALLWMTAACVDSAMATSIGFAYCAFRMFCARASLDPCSSG